MTRSRLEHSSSNDGTDSAEDLLDEMARAGGGRYDQCRSAPLQRKPADESAAATIGRSIEALTRIVVELALLVPEETEG